MSQKNSLCAFLDWDSEFFGYRIGRVLPDTLSTESLQEIMQWCADNRIDCLYFLANPSHLETTKLVESENFHLVDIRFTFENRLSMQQATTNQDTVVRLAELGDISQLKEIASVNHRDSRFYYDGNFPVSKCDELFALWIEKSCQDYADAVFVVAEVDQIAGYITCTLTGQAGGSIGLLGVNPEFRGKGTGRILVEHALKWFAENNVENVSVVTQGRNVNAQRLYQRNGFITQSLKIWYHLWLK